MSAEPTLSTLATCLKPILRSAINQGMVLYRERQAGRTGVEPNLLDSRLDETLNRLRAGKVEDSWWRQLLHKLGQEFIAPEFLKKTDLQQWIADEGVAGNLKSLAKRRVMGDTESDPHIVTELKKIYAKKTGEAERLAGEPIDVIVDILAAGYLASLSPEQHPLAGMLQELSGQIREGFDRSERTHLTASPVPIIQQFITDRAENELAEILSFRAFDSVSSRTKIQKLVLRLNAGDLTAACISTKIKVYRWATKLCAQDHETLPQAKEFRTELREIDPNLDLTIEDALVAEADGDTKKALRLLRDQNDPESRSVLFGLLCRLEDEHTALTWLEKQDIREDSLLLTPSGWSMWAICMAKLEKWKAASLRLASLEDPWMKMPSLACIEGSINAAMLLPDEKRKMVLDQLPLLTGITPILGSDAEKYHARAVSCFKFVEQSLQGITNQNLKEYIADWLLWLRLMDPNSKDSSAACDEIRLRMNHGEEAVQAIPFAIAFGISFDTPALKHYLENREALGGLDDDERLAECLLFQRTMEPGDFVRYLEKNKDRLGKLSPPSRLEMNVDALVRDGQDDKARNLVKENEGGFEKVHTNRLMLMIDVPEGTELRQRLEDIYDQSGSFSDLYNLISFLKSAGDRPALLPLIRKYFSQVRTVKNALDVVSCLVNPPAFDHESVIQFLEENSDLLEQSLDLKSIKAWAMFHAGRFPEAQEINGLLLAQRDDQNDLFLDTKIAFSSGDWERLTAIIDREWPRREHLPANVLMSLAWLAGQQEQVSDRALQLAMLAAEKAPSDPEILAVAYGLFFKLGRDADANPEWLRRAVELSSSDEGPVWSVDVKELTTDWLPRQHDYQQEVERKWLRGEIPMGLAASFVNMSLVQFFLRYQGQNFSHLDVRKQLILPIAAGVRSPVVIKENWSIGLDLTSVMALVYLDLLNETFDALHSLKLSPDIMECLWREREKVRFHQPSRIEAAKRILNLHDQGKLKAEENPPLPADNRSSEVGPELASLLELAKHKSGKVICVLPIRKYGPSLEQEADTSGYDDVIISITDFCTQLHDQGKIALADYHRAKLVLQRQIQTEPDNFAPLNFEDPFYIDRAALHYLEETKLLLPMAGAGLDIHVHPDVLAEMRSLSQTDDTSRYLVGKIEEIRCAIKDVVNSGKATYLPRATDQNEQIQEHETFVEATVSLFRGSAFCDAICIDDRVYNQFLTQSEPGREVSIICVLDILQHLASLERIDIVDYWTARHKLRQGGFGIIPLLTDEMAHWLREAKIDDGQLVESVELRAIRQNITCVSTLDWTTPEEELSLANNITGTCMQVIFELGDDQSLAPQKATILTDWIWRKLMTTVIPGYRHFSPSDYPKWIREVMTKRLGCLFAPVPSRSQEHHVQYNNWIEQAVLGPLWPANTDLTESALDFSIESISHISENEDAFGNLYLRQLPINLRRIVCARNPAFAEKSGFREEWEFSIGEDIKLLGSKLFNAVRKVFADGGELTVENKVGNNVTVQLESKEQNIVFARLDSEGTPHNSFPIPEFSLLSPNKEMRNIALRKVIERIGPATKDFQNLYEKIQLRPPNSQEFSRIISELANGVVSIQSVCANKMTSESSFGLRDLIPQSVTYFEKFCGPNPGALDPDTYFQDVLVSFRIGLLGYNLGAGLDICCLGALRDDLAPGRWIENYDNDAVWEALSSSKVQGTPFSLLGALDIALYRQEDERFQDFAADAITQLTDVNFGRRDGLDIYELLAILTSLVINQINILPNGANYPGFWKRMSAWMQAGWIVRTMTEAFIPIDINSLREWAIDNMVRAGAYSGLIDAREEPMYFGSSITSQDFRGEMLRRLQALKVLHEGLGHTVPLAENINHLITGPEGMALPEIFYSRGPLVAHKGPTIPIPSEHSDLLEKAWAENNHPWAMLVTVSQLYVLSEKELDRARQNIMGIVGEGQGISLQVENMDLELASIVAAASRDTILADSLGRVAVNMARMASKEKEIQKIFQIILQAAAAYEKRVEWFHWLEEKLAQIATCLPQGQNNVLSLFLGCLDEIQVILPADSWFHIRARCIALAGEA
ncbi:MAG: hypothetical protein OXC05_03310 [Halieaceae bacterium]|nr:hypothetical protein [Halieaceae bacterium]